VISRRWAIVIVACCIGCRDERHDTNPTIEGVFPYEVVMSFHGGAVFGPTLPSSSPPALGTILRGHIQSLDDALTKASDETDDIGFELPIEEERAVSYGGELRSGRPATLRVELVDAGELSGCERVLREPLPDTALLFHVSIDSEGQRRFDALTAHLGVLGQVSSFAIAAPFPAKGCYVARSWRMSIDAELGSPGDVRVLWEEDLGVSHAVVDGVTHQELSADESAGAAWQGRLSVISGRRSSAAILEGEAHVIEGTSSRDVRGTITECWTVDGLEYYASSAIESALRLGTTSSCTRPLSSVRP
jgi:hypothetical protein